MESTCGTYVELQIGEVNGVNVLRHDLFTNDVVYSEVVFDMSPIKKELLQLVPLFWYVIFFSLILFAVIV